MRCEAGEEKDLSTPIYQTGLCRCWFRSIWPTLLLVLHVLLVPFLFRYRFGMCRCGPRCVAADRFATRFRSVAAGAPFTTPADVHDR